MDLPPSSCRNGKFETCARGLVSYCYSESLDVQSRHTERQSTSRKCQFFLRAYHSRFSYFAVSLKDGERSSLQNIVRFEPGMMEMFKLRHKPIPLSDSVKDEYIILDTVQGPKRRGYLGD
jgi:hypothetical protein